MNLHRWSGLSGISIALAALILGPTLRAEDTTAAHFAAHRDGVRAAAKTDADRRADKLVGKTLVDRSGTKLGSIKDFLLQPDSGRIRYAVVSTGGWAGIGDKLHCVPFYLLSEQGNDGNFVATISVAQLRGAPVLDEDAFDKDHITIDSQREHALTDAFSGSGANVRSSLAAPGPLVRATKLRGREVRGEGAALGTIDGVVIERGSVRAVAELKPSGRGGDGRYLVPLDRLHVPDDGNAAITTTLTSADFGAASQSRTASDSNAAAGSNVTSAQQSSNVAADAASGTTASTVAAATTSTQADLTPTGRTSADQNPSASLNVISAARTIRRALDKDEDLAHADVKVTPSAGRVIVQGTVDSPDQKSAIEHAATNAAQGANIDFNLAVRNQ